MLSIIKAAIDIVNNTVQAYETHIENETTIEVVKEKRLLKKASNITENILLLVDKYLHLFSEKDKNQYQKLKAKFLKLN